MVITYPIFGRDKDEWMFMINSESGLGHLEAIDIEGKEYVGWDATGIPIGFYLDKGKIRVRPLPEKAQLERLKQAILDYAAVARPKFPFSYSGLEYNIIELFKAVEEHIGAGGRMGKIKGFLRRFTGT